MLYCVKCRERTEDLNPKETISKNGKPMIKAQCAVCGTTKNQFIKQN